MKLKEHDEKLDKNYITTDEFAYIFETCFKGAVESYQKQKIHCFKGILVNSLRLNTKQEEKEYYLYLVNTLSDLHLRVLAFFSNPELYFETQELPSDGVASASFSEMVSRAFPGINLEVIKSAHTELFQRRLMNTDSGIYGTVTANTGLILLKDV